MKELCASFSNMAVNTDSFEDQGYHVSVC